MRPLPLVLLLGCTPSPSPAATSEPRTQPSSSAAVTTLPPATGFQADADLPDTAAPVPRRAHINTETDPADGSVGATEWLNAHGIAPANLVDRIYDCQIVKLGSPPQDGLFCPASQGPMKESLKTGESVFPLTVWVADKQVLRSVLEVPLVAAALDQELDPPGSPPHDYSYIRLEATLDPNGTSIEIHERPSQTCADVLASYTDPELNGHRKMVQAACRSRGTYTWNGARFARAQPSH